MIHQINAIQGDITSKTQMRLLMQPTKAYLVDRVFAVLFLTLLVMTT